MSNNCNSTVNNIAEGFMLGLLLAAIIILFPVLPGAVLGWELAKHLQLNQDIMIMLALLGAFVNFGFYQIMLWLSSRSYQTKEKIITYLFSITALLVMNDVFENKFLKGINELFFKALFFFTDFSRWFTDVPMLNGLLFLLYAFVMLMLYAYILRFIRQGYAKYRKKYYINGVRR